MKKSFSKLLSLVVSATLALSCLSTTSLAVADETLGKAPDGHTYQLYQIFTGDIDSSGVLSNVKWGASGVNGLSQEGYTPTAARVGTEPDQQVLADIMSVADTDSKTTTEAEKLAVIQKYVNFDAPIKSTSQADQPASVGENSNKLVYSNLTPGYYLIRDYPTSQTGKNDVYTLYVVQTSGSTLEFQTKGSVPEVDKKIKLADGGTTSANSASIGDTINYQITANVSSQFASYKTYYLKFSDTLSKGLTLNNNSFKVTIDGKDVTDYFYKGATVNNDGTTSIEVSIADLKRIQNLNLGITITSDTDIVLEYSAVLNKDAATGTESNPNDVKLIFSNDPNNSGSGESPDEPDKPTTPPTPSTPTGETPTSTVKTYTTSLEVTKIDGVSKAILQGAEFTLTGAGVNQALVTEDVYEKADDGTYYLLKDNTYTTEAPVIADDETDNSNLYQSTTDKYKKTTQVVLKGTGQTDTNVVGMVNEEGKVTFTGLGAGTYTLTETKTPAGYNTIDPINFTISFGLDESNAGVFSVNNSAITASNNALTSTIENMPGSSLPHTGGIGTTLFYLIGGALVLIAGVSLVSRRRMRKEQ